MLEMTRVKDQCLLTGEYWELLVHPVNYPLKNPILSYRHFSQHY